MDENNYPVKINEAELKAKLDSLSYDVLRNAATERPFTGEYTDTDKVGVYKCKACAAELFRSETPMSMLDEAAPMLAAFNGAKSLTTSTTSFNSLFDVEDPLLDTDVNEMDAEAEEAAETFLESLEG